MERPPYADFSRIYWNHRIHDPRKIPCGTIHDQADCTDADGDGDEAYHVSTISYPVDGEVRKYFVFCNDESRGCLEKYTFATWGFWISTRTGEDAAVLIDQTLDQYNEINGILSKN